VDLPPLVFIEATGSSILISNCEVLLAAVYKSPNRSWCDTDITDLLGFRNKCVLAGDLNAKHPFWNSAISNPSGEKLLQLYHVNDFEISAPQNPTHYSPAGNGDVLHRVLWSITTSDSHTLLSLTSWIQITYQQYFTYWNMLPHKDSRNHLKNSQIGNGFRTLPLTKYRLE
jgi:hypothetical protein